MKPLQGCRLVASDPSPRRGDTSSGRSSNRARLTSSLLTAATDCRYFRVRGVPCYGFLPFKLTARDFDGFHGNNERLSVENVHAGMRLFYEIVRRLASR